MLHRITFTIIKHNIMYNILSYTILFYFIMYICHILLVAYKGNKYYIKQPWIFFHE